MKKELLINKVKISNDSPAYLIAEIGLNHNKDLNLVKKMIQSAKESGANAVKFQTYITEKLYFEESPVFKIFKDLELSKDEFSEINQYCKKIDITFFSTPFDFESADFLEKLDVPCYKIASMDLNYYNFIEYIAKKGKPVILSTGMSSFSEIDKAISVIKKTGNDDIVLMHCISKYPPKPEEMNLPIMKIFKNMYPDIVIGFSDHSLDSTCDVIARTMGACVFEKHFTLDKELEGPDHKISCEPKDFIELKSKLGITDNALNYSYGIRSDFEIAIHARRSLAFRQDMKQGDVLSKENILVVRPGDGLSPEYLETFIGKTLKKPVKKGQKLDISLI